MVVPKSQLSRFVLDCIRDVELARGAALSELIQTESPEITFTVQVIDDTQQGIEVARTEQTTPEVIATTKRLPSTSEQTTETPEITSHEKQTTTQGAERQEQTFGRSSETINTVTS